MERCIQSGLSVLSTIGDTVTDREKVQIPTQDRVRLHLWDWKEQPDFEAISQSMRTLFDGTHCPKIVPVPNSQRDEYVVFVTSEPLSSSEAQALWDSWDWEYEESRGRR